MKVLMVVVVVQSKEQLALNSQTLKEAKVMGMNKARDRVPVTCRINW